MCTDGRSTIIIEDVLGNVEITYNISTDKVSYSSSTSSFESYCLDPFGITLCYSKDPYLAPKRWANGTDEVNGPGVKWPGVKLYILTR